MAVDRNELLGLEFDFALSDEDVTSPCLRRPAWSRTERGIDYERSTRY